MKKYNIIIIRSITALLVVLHTIFTLQGAFAAKHLKGAKETGKKASRTIPFKTYATGTVEVTLNGLKITIDKQTGSITGLDYPGPGKILEAAPERAGLIDVAYPLPEFEALRLASRYSQGPKIEQSGNSIVITWDGLGASRTYFKPSGKVSATVWIKAMPDGRSVSMKCRVENKSERLVGQVLFPDFHGLLPVAGREGTYFRSLGFVRRPFVDVGMTLYPEMYALDDKIRPIDTRDTYEYTGGKGMENGDSMIGRWLDYGGLNGGISLFPKLWAGAPETKVRIFRLEKDPNVRLMHVHDKSIKKGETWESPEYVLTPHQSGWAKGIETYKEFVDSKVNRLFPVPKHVREGLGFRSIFMSRWYPADGENDRSFTFADLPAIAKECKANGIDQIVVWHWFRHFILPIQDPYSNLGTPEELSKAIKECEKIGVNVSLTLSITSISEPTVSRYGMKMGGNLGWTYHPEMIPRFNPPYTAGRATIHANTNDPRWQKDVLASVKKVYDNYTHSITWDQAHPGTEELFRQFLPWVKKDDPRATFSAEITNSAELLADYLDFTWNWQSGSYHHNLMAPYRDIRGFNASFPAPRLNYSINRNAQDIKYAFMDNSYVNIMPSKPDGANGTAWIKDYPEIGHVLKQCAGVRSKFLNYFTDGKLIGECLLKEESPDAHVNAYVLPDRVLFMVMNTADRGRQVNFKVDLEPWLKSKTGKYEVRSYDQYGTSFGDDEIIGREWSGQTQQMRNMDFAIYEFISKK
ncbi:MAG: hypothetical protein WKF68_12445 [Daejeonella sp.]